MSFIMATICTDEINLILPLSMLVGPFVVIALPSLRTSDKKNTLLRISMTYYFYASCTTVLHCTLGGIHVYKA